jgi:hypothetical protein
MDETEQGRRLRELLDMYSSGALSEDQFVQARARILAEAAPTAAGVRWDVTAPAFPPADATGPRPPTSPLPPGVSPPGGQPRPPAQRSDRRTRPVLITVSAVAVVVLLAVGAFLWVRSRGTVAPQEAAATAAATSGAGSKFGRGTSTATHPGPPATVPPDTALAGCVSQPSNDAAGNPTSYEPALAVDGLTDTAWRCDGDGVGQTLEIRFGTPRTIQTIGLVPGFAKTDPYDGTDRYAQDRRIAAVQYTFDDGTTAVQRFDTDPNDRRVQSIEIPDVTTQRVVITILATVPGSPVNGQPAVDKVAVSEVVYSEPGD